MNTKFFVITSSFFVYSFIGHAAPHAGSTPAKPKPNANAKPIAAKTVAAKISPAPVGVQTGVLINEVTRNEKDSKVSFALAKNGKALAPIVISEKASAETKLVADDLKKYLDQMTGAKFKIETGDGSEGIVLGNKNEFPTLALDKALAIVHSFDGKEAYAIRTRDKRILILGATDLGASHGAYRMLEEMGCRWFFPNPTGDWEVVPSIPDLKFNKEITDRPAFLSRTIWYSWGYFSDDGHPLGAGHNANTDTNDWNRRNAMNHSFDVNTGHALQNVIAQNQAEFDKHPEYYAEQGGKRLPGQLEMGNPRVREMVLDYARDYFKTNPNSDMVSVDPPDGYGFSESAETKAWAGDPMAAPFKMANEVAVMLQKEFPAKMVGLLAYAWRSDPPPFNLEPNVYIQRTTAFVQGKMKGEERERLWPLRARNLGSYDYYSVWRWDADRWPGGRAGNSHYIIDSIRGFHQVNQKSGAYATSISAESGNNWGPNGRGYYLASKLMWNPDADADAILTDFYQKAFGAGATEMRRYYEMQDDQQLMTVGVYGAMFRHVDAAAKAAAGDVGVLRRIADVKSYLNFEGLRYRADHEANPASTEHTQQAWQLAYRTRYKYMEHWMAIASDWINPAGGMEIATKIKKPFTPEENETLFQENLNYFPDLKVPERLVFSKELVPVDLSTQTSGKASAFQSSLFGTYTTDAIIYLYSSGAPLKLRIEKINGPDYADENYYITGAQGKRVASIKPDKPGQTVFDLNVPVPAAGLYALHPTYANAQQVTFKSPSDQVIAYPVEINTTVSTQGPGLPDLYFYVPKGTKTIEYYFQRTYNGAFGAHDVTDPNGKVVRNVDISGDYVSIPVAPETDGKAWKVGGPAWGLGQFRFFNIPSVLCVSPAQLLVPKEVAVKDGLKILK